MFSAQRLNALVPTVINEADQCFCILRGPPAEQCFAFFFKFGDGSGDDNDDNNGTDRFGLMRAFDWLLICILVNFDISCEILG